MTLQEAERRLENAIKNGTADDVNYWRGYRDALMAAEPAPSDPLTLEQLREMVGEPVRIERHDSHPINRWAIVGDFESLYGVYFGTAFGGLRLPYEDYGKTWIAYRRKPEEVSQKDI